MYPNKKNKAMYDNLEQLTEVPIPLPTKFTGTIRAIRSDDNTKEKVYIEYVIFENVLASITHSDKEIKDD